MNGHHPLNFNRDRNVRDDLVHTPQHMSKAEQPTTDAIVDTHVLPTLHHERMYRPVTVIFPSHMGDRCGS